MQEGILVKDDILSVKVDTNFPFIFIPSRVGYWVEELTQYHYVLCKWAKSYVGPWSLHFRFDHLVIPM